MNRPVVYVTLQQFCEEDDQPKRLLEAEGFDVRQNALGRRLRREELATMLSEAAAVVAGIEPYDAGVLAALPRLRCISRCGVGVDSIDIEAARRLGIAIYRTVDEVIEPVAQMTLAMILALARNLPLHTQDVREGRWTKRTGVLLSEWTIGLVGFGRIGQAVERLLRPFGPRVLANDPMLQHAEVPRGVDAVPLNTLLARADLVSLHADRQREAGALIGEREFSVMKPGSFLVNTSRGYLVDQDALLSALQSGHLAGAALDVFEPEPYTGPLARLSQVLATPHVASLTRASRAAMERRAVEQLIEHFSRAGVAP